MLNYAIKFGIFLSFFRCNLFNKSFICKYYIRDSSGIKESGWIERLDWTKRIYNTAAATQSALNNVVFMNLIHLLTFYMAYEGIRLSELAF